ncbi:MAG: hypothetical protein M9962_09420 [Oligoflexia bacterium]|nr:hypothetical protein [Oligoflexia bacterium]
MTKVLYSLFALFLFAPIASAESFELDFDVHSYSEVPPGMALQKVADLTSTKDSDIHYLNVMIDTNGLIAGLYNKPDPNNGKESGAPNVFWLRDIESKEGAVLAVAKGRKALIMQGLLNRQTQEGTFDLHYLSNGLTMKYKTCKFNLRKNQNGWYAQNFYNNSVVSRIHVVTHSLGISTIEGICPN